MAQDLRRRDKAVPKHYDNIPNGKGSASSQGGWVRAGAGGQKGEQA